MFVMYLISRIFLNFSRSKFVNFAVYSSRRHSSPTAEQTAVQNRNKPNRGYFQNQDRDYFGNPDKYTREAEEHRQKKKDDERMKVLQQNREKEAMRQRALYAGQLNREKQRRKQEEAKTRGDDVRETGNQQGELGILQQGKLSTNQEEVITGTVNPSKGTQSETLAEQLVNRDLVLATKIQDDPSPLVTENPLRGDQTKATKEKTPVVLEDTQRRESGGDVHIAHTEINEDHQKDGRHNGDHQKDSGHNGDQQKDGGQKKKVRQTPEQQQTGRTRAATVPVAPKLKARTKDEQSNQKLPHVIPRKDPQTEHAQDVHEQPVPVIKKERPKSQNMHVHKGKQIKGQDMHHHKMGRNEIANEHGRSEHQPDIKAPQHPHPSPVGRERAATAQI